MDPNIAIVVLFALYIAYLLGTMLIKAYFTARERHIMKLVDKAKEIQRGKE